MKEKIYFITSNPGKFAQAKSVMPEIEQLDIDLIEIQETDAKKIIEHKLKEAIKTHSGCFLVEDNSLHINALNGLPGPLIKWFLEKLGRSGIYDLIKDKEDKSAKTICHLGLSMNGKITFFNSEATGTIVKPTGNNGFGWDALFLADGENKTYAEMTPEKKNQKSVRITLFKKVKEFLDS